MNKKINFNLKFNKLLYLSIPVILLITLPFIISRITNIVRMSGTSEGYSAIIDVIVILLLLAILALSLTCIFIARYTLTGKSLILRIGVFKTTIPISKIVNITFFRASNKLAVFYKDGEDIKQILVNIADSKFDKFVEELRSANKNISYFIDSNE